MSRLKDYMNDGADPQAQATLAFLREFDVEESWDKERHCYTAEIKVARWENGREQGYVVFLRDQGGRQLNIAFFEHRNSDALCAVKWEQFTFNAPTIDTADFGDIYQTKWDVSHSLPYGAVIDMAEWIEKQFTQFWIAGQQNRTAKGTLGEMPMQSEAEYRERKRRIEEESE